MDNGKGAFDSLTASQVQSMIAAAMASGTSPAEFNYAPSEGELLTIPPTDAVIINVLLWPSADLNAVTLQIPNTLVAGRRVFIYTADKSIAQLTVTAGPGVTVSNGVTTMNKNDLIVCNTVSTTSKIIARVATS